MAAYAALLSLKHTIEQIQLHPCPPISLPEPQIEPLIEKVTFLLHFLESYSVDTDALESRMANAACEAEDLVELHIVEKIETSHNTSLASFFKATSIRSKDEFLYQGLQKVIQELESITIELKEMKPKAGGEIPDEDCSLPAFSGSFIRRSASSADRNLVVGFDDVMVDVMERLTNRNSSSRVIPIVGMGGIGKTTLARSIYANPVIVQYFDVRGWATVSQDFSVRKILLEVVCSVETAGDNGKRLLNKMSEQELGEKLYKCLLGRRYLVVMDDIWSIKAWNRVKNYFPDNNEGSAILLTTRLSNLASDISGSRGLEMDFLDEDKSWNLLCKIVFGEEDCPLELEASGKKIAENCRGLPLSITVIGGLLAKSDRTLKHWRHVAENLSSIVNLDDNERCFRILLLSYNHLPIHLKPCFLYTAVFPEDHVIRVSKLVRLWVSEGILKPISGKSLEVTGKEYINDLIDRNLILSHRKVYFADVKSCTIHDLIRDLCIKLAEKERFLCVTETSSIRFCQSWLTQRRISVRGNTSKRRINSVKFASFARSLICDGHERVVPIHPFRLLRIIHQVDAFDYYTYPRKRRTYSLKNIFRQISLRHLEILAKPDSKLPSSIYNLWNLHTLSVDSRGDDYAQLLDIWKMPHLRHVKFFSLRLTDPPPPTTRGDTVILQNLQTLKSVKDFRCGDEAVRRIPNIEKLKITYCSEGSPESPSFYRLDNLCRLSKLESLHVHFTLWLDPLLGQPGRGELARSLVLPHSLKKLRLEGTGFGWEEVGMKIGRLPCLEVLKLGNNSVSGLEWKTVEGQFRSLKYLHVSECSGLERWRTESGHFPCLERLVLANGSLLSGSLLLKEIPWEIGNIPTLKRIDLIRCNDSAIMSAKEMMKEQEDLGNEELWVRVQLGKDNKVEGASLAAPNFHVFASDGLF
ncbi:disease resistance protein [Striga asiatica]|uniref:Disease resistance protein n=1 Tax=Striga asiatica TaxID=4170 RepID=A0A5A7QHB4_STRAF|nr:disease resistance protein [Striga asiatica]